MLKKMQESDVICKLNKVLYGLRKFARQWHAEFDSVLQDVGLTSTNAFVLVYVNDILIIFNNQRKKRQIGSGQFFQNKRGFG